MNCNNEKFPNQTLFKSVLGVFIFPEIIVILSEVEWTQSDTYFELHPTA